MNINYKYLSFAYYISSLSDYSKYHVGCILVYKGRIISEGWNMEKTHPIQKRYNRFRFNSDDNPHKLHAETICILRANQYKDKFSKSVLYIFREHCNGKWALARPCLSCMNFIKDNGIKKLCYTTEDGYAFEYLI
jgi:deoxycytidylate deaminase